MTKDEITRLLGGLTEHERDLAIEVIENSKSVKELIEENKELREQLELWLRIEKGGKLQTFSKYAKETHIKDPITNKELGSTKIYKALREIGILLKTDTNWNIPQDRYIKIGYFELTRKLRSNTNIYDNVALITPKGQVFVLKKLTKYLKDKK